MLNSETKAGSALSIAPGRLSITPDSPFLPAPRCGHVSWSLRADTRWPMPASVSTVSQVVTSASPVQTGNYRATATSCVASGWRQPQGASAANRGAWLPVPTRKTCSHQLDTQPSSCFSSPMSLAASSHCPSHTVVSHVGFSCLSVGFPTQGQPHPGPGLYHGLQPA